MLKCMVIAGHIWIGAPGDPVHVRLDGVQYTKISTTNLGVMLYVRGSNLSVGVKYPLGKHQQEMSGPELLAQCAEEAIYLDEPIVETN